jgi:hypothetical protein
MGTCQRINPPPARIPRKETEILNWLALAAVLIALGSIAHTIIKWKSGR